MYVIFINIDQRRSLVYINIYLFNRIWYSSAFPIALIYTGVTYTKFAKLK